MDETIRSVISQGYPNLEYIIIDGGSRDESISVIQKYEKHITCWVSEPDQGQTDALAKGFDRATGDILCWLCSDDLLEPGALLEVGRIFAANPAFDVVYGDTTNIDEEGAIIRRYKTLPFHRWLLLNTGDYIPQPSTFWRRRIYEQVGGLNRSLHMGMDPDLWMRFSEITQLHHVRQYWSRMRFYPGIKSLTRSRESLIEHRRLEVRYLGTRPEMVRLASRSFAKLVRIGYKAYLGCYWA